MLLAFFGSLSRLDAQRFFGFALAHLFLARFVTSLHVILTAFDLPVDG